jgi:GT2 family glycosyltransferase
MVAVKQVDADGETWPSIRRFPTVMRTFGAAIGTERWPRLNRLLGERVLVGPDYDQAGPCDWTTGAVMFVRADTVREVGPFDERFFLYSEETDLAYRLRRAGWSNIYVPSLVVLHHAGKAGVVPRLEAQMAWARWQYARKHAGRLAQVGFMLGLITQHGLRALLLRGRATSSSSAAASVYSLRVLAGVVPPPFEEAR